MLSLPELQTLRVNTVGNAFIEIAYKQYPNMVCVFSATNGAENGSSINWAEDIAKAIAFQLGVEVLELRFFDLQTRTSYSAGFGGAGGFQFDEIEFVPHPHRGIYAKAWTTIRCPDYIIKDFNIFLDGDPHQDSLMLSS